MAQMKAHDMPMKDVTSFCGTFQPSQTIFNYFGVGGECPRMNNLGAGSFRRRRGHGSGGGCGSCKAGGHGGLLEHGHRRQNLGHGLARRSSSSQVGLKHKKNGCLSWLNRLRGIAGRLWAGIFLCIWTLTQGEILT